MLELTKTERAFALLPKHTESGILLNRSVVHVAGGVYELTADYAEETPEWDTPYTTTVDVVARFRVSDKGDDGLSVHVVSVVLPNLTEGNDPALVEQVIDEIKAAMEHGGFDEWDDNGYLAELDLDSIEYGDYPTAD